MERFNYIVIGGGIAGVTCAETLSQWSPDDEILLPTASPLIKAITNFKMVSKTLEEFDVEEKPMAQLNAECPNVKVCHDTVNQLDSEKKIISTAGGHQYEYGKICICSGGTPKVIAEESPHVIGIRDTETVKVFQKKLKNARRIVLVGNGGIATELAYEVEGCEVVWAIRDSSITSTFVDAGAAEFFLPQLAADKESDAGPSKRLKYTLDETCPAAGDKKEVLGSALGPDWSAGLDMHGTVQSSHQVHIEYKVEVERVLSPEDVKKENIVPEVLPSQADSQKAEDWPVYVMLTNNKVYGCDFVVSATGVVPNTDPFTKGNKFDISEDGGIKVNERMETNICDVYAAGDVCTASWELAPHWIQMRLWSQARQMGHYAAKCMLASTKGEDVIMDFCFELFAHVTKFFNYKVILLGKFNAQGFGKDHELLLRVTKGKEYVKVVLKDGRMEGAILIGETDLEETFENLILNKMDLSVYGEDLLNPDIDIEDYFD